MKALIFVDWCTIKDTAKDWILPGTIIAVVTILTGYADIEANPDALAFHIYTTLASTSSLMISFFGYFALFGTDEVDGWEAVRLSLPIARRDVVRARYLSLLLWFAVLALTVNIVSLVCAAVISLVMYGTVGLPPASDAALLNVVIFIVYLVYLAIETPIFFSKGFAKARAYFSLPFLFCLLFALDFVKEAANAALDRIGMLIQALGSPAPLMIGTIVLAFAAYGASMTVSERIYSTRNF